ncbi:PolC-type DNA polymerase III [Mitsuokella sp. AF21-1AC]|uniref:PolC-type DNA polymerase III n=1 Tax=Mitsuokella sp. AF21-1AC TaxID=2292235 RepID=UPI000E4AC4C3|nr:PolC-type DNA polymerase III [Mitsuokella sp. AF21-1AC]RGS74504.1 PolC-type DNA polymerase III [Mitsuokella sp. AF21-1AC]
MQKYRIVPSQDNMFWQLIQGMRLTDEQKELLKACTIRHVEVSPHTSTWEIALTSQLLIADDLLQEAARQIEKKCQLKKVIFYQDVVNVEDAVSKIWPKLVYETAEGNPTVYELLKRSKYTVDGSHILIDVPGELGGEIMRAHAVTHVMGQIVERMLGYRCRIECNASEEVLQNLEVDDCFNTREYREAVRKERAHSAQGKEAASATSAPQTATAAPAAKKTAPAAKKAAAKSHRKDARGPVIIQSAGSLVFGRGVMGEVRKIDELEGEMKNVILEGTIGEGPGSGLKTIEFKTGTKLLTFCLADDTNGIACKKFFKTKRGRNAEPEDYDAIMGQLKEGMSVRVRGSVRFDTYMNEYVLFVDSLAKKEAKLREDHAEVKRVELHAHTTMSSMDAVVSVKDLIKTADRWGWPAVAVTDHGVVQAFPDAAKALKDCKTDIKVIYGMEGYLVQEDYEQKRANHIIFLAKNPNGLRNLYQMVSLAHLKYFHRQPRLPKRIIEEYRDGLLIGSACEAGELIRAIEERQTDEELLKIADFYDYLEIQPIHNNDFLKRSDKYPDIRTDDDLIRINLKIAELAKKLGKPLVATCDVHFLNPEDKIYRAILMKGKGFDDAELQPPLYLRTTEEMLAEFSYLGEEAAYEAVVTNPRRIAEQIERFKPIPDDLYSPQIPGADEEIRSMSYKKARELYGENLPKIVEDRLQQELKPIIGHGFSVLYLIAQRLVKKSNDDGYLVGSRGSVGSSFIATMTGITEVNPLPPHWRCPHCQYSKFITDGSYGCGYDLPDKVCPVCGTPLVKDGHDIPFAVFLGFDGDKVPDIDLNFSGTYQPVAHKYTEVLFGKDNVYRAGSIQTVADKTAFGYVKKFFEEKGVKKHLSYIDKLAHGCMGVKSTTGQHPAGIMVVPRNMDVHFFTPIQHPANDMNCGTITTHFDYHSISSRLVKLDILGHDDPTVIKMLEDLTHRDPKTIPFDDKATMSIFNSTDALGVTPEELGATSGTFGIPEFRTPFTRQMIDDTQPDVFSDLVRISGFSHGTDVWLGNAQDLIRSGQCTIKNAISARDDIMMYLIHNGIDPLLSFKTMEKVRKGKGIASDVVETLRKGGIPEWFIESCQKIKYLFPRAHATAYVMMAYRIAFCKVHYPLAYYAAYFSIRAAEFDANVVARGKDYVGQQIAELEAIAKEKKLDAKQNATLIVLQLAWELYLRGFGCEYVDLYRSDAEKFIILENSLLPPLASLSGMGTKAAQSIVEARKDGMFTSIEDLRRRSGISKTNIEILRQHGCLDGMSESDQIALFV